MSPDELKALVRRFFDEVWNQQRMDVIDEVFAPTVVLNGQAVKREAFRQIVSGRRAAFPDIRVTVEDQSRKVTRSRPAGPGMAPIEERIGVSPRQANR